MTVPPSEPAGLTREAALAVLDIGTAPVLIVELRARVVHANRAAHALFSAKRTFHHSGGRLTVQRQADQEAIEAAISSAVTEGERSLLRLTNRQEDAHHLLSVVPLPGGALAALCIAELRAPLLPQKNWSREALMLPAAYAELAEALADGENLAEFAERTGLTIGGSRTRLKKLLRRLSTRSQSDLVSLLLRASAVLQIR